MIPAWTTTKVHTWWEWVVFHQGSQEALHNHLAGPLRWVWKGKCAGDSAAGGCEATVVCHVSSSQYGWRETNCIITPHSGSRHLCDSLLQTGWEARVKINPLFNPKSLKHKLWALLLPVNGSGSEQNLVWLRVFSPSEAPALPSALSSKAPRRSARLCPSAGRLCLVLPTQHSAKPCDTHQFFAQVDYLLLLFIYRLFINGFGEFYFVSVEFEWSVSIFAHLFWSEMLCFSATATGSECHTENL